MLVRWSLRYWTKAECCGEPVSLVGPIVLLTNFTSDHISSALGKSPFSNASASPFWNGSATGPRHWHTASADSEAPDPTMNARREIAILSSPASPYMKERRGRIIVNASDATTHIGQLLTPLDRRPQVSFR